MTAAQWGSVAPAGKGGPRRGGAARKMIPPNKVTSNFPVWQISFNLINGAILLDVKLFRCVFTGWMRRGSEVGICI